MPDDTSPTSRIIVGQLPEKGATDKYTGIVIPITRGNDRPFVAKGEEPVPVGRPTGLPLTNPLHVYTSFNSIFTLYLLTPEEYNFPDLSYKRGIEPRNVLLRSGGQSTRFNKTAYEQANSVVEYFIEDISINSVVHPNTITGTTMSNTLTFKITEPYSLGMFLETIKITAYNEGYVSHIDAPLLLKIDFKGWNDEGKSQDVGQTSFIPFKITNMRIAATEAGSMYEVDAVTYNQVALTDQVQTTNQDISITGSNLIEVLQTGPESLATRLNERAIENEQQNSNVRGDRYIIQIPDDISSFFNTGQDKADDTGEGATVSPADLSFDDRFNQSINLIDQPTAGELSTRQANFKKLYSGGGDKNLLEQLAFAARENVNLKIGLKRVIGDWTAPGELPYPLPGTVIDETTGLYKRQTKGMEVSDDKRRFTFTSGTKIENIIEMMMVNSAYGRQLVEQFRDTPVDGMVRWFRIETQVFIDSNTEQAKRGGRFPLIYVYRVVEYKLLHTFFKASTVPAIGMENARNQVAKEYNYLYTGKNQDILDFNLEFNNAYFMNLPADYGNAGLHTRSGGANTGIINDKQEEFQLGAAGPAGSQGVAATQETRSSTGNTGVQSLDAETRVAMEMHRAFINSSADLITLEMQILGDPYYLPNSGVGNYVQEDSIDPGLFNIKPDGSMNHTNGQVNVNVIFQTPVDIKEDGLYDFANTINEKGNVVSGFSGIYRVMAVVHNFNNGQFTQTLDLVRHRDQETSDTKNTPVLASASPESQDTVTQQNIQKAEIAAINERNKNLSDTF
jgi:hypothetical protein